MLQASATAMSDFHQRFSQQQAFVRIEHVGTTIEVLAAQRDQIYGRIVAPER